MRRASYFPPPFDGGGDIAQPYWRAVLIHYAMISLGGIRRQTASDR